MNNMYWTTFSELKKGMLSLVPRYISESDIDKNIADIQSSLIKNKNDMPALIESKYLYKELIDNCNNFEFMMLAIAKNNKLSRSYLSELFNKEEGEGNQSAKQFKKKILIKLLEKKG